MQQDLCLCLGWLLLLRRNTHFLPMTFRYQACRAYSQGNKFPQAPWAPTPHNLEGSTSTHSSILCSQSNLFFLLLKTPTLFFKQILSGGLQCLSHKESKPCYNQLFSTTKGENADTFCMGPEEKHMVANFRACTMLAVFLPSCEMSWLPKPGPDIEIYLVHVILWKHLSIYCSFLFEHSNHL